jgi:hypothetical protein
METPRQGELLAMLSDSSNSHFAAFAADALSLAEQRSSSLDTSGAEKSAKDSGELKGPPYTRVLLEVMTGEGGLTN